MRQRFLSSPARLIPTDVTTLSSGMRIASQTLPGETATVGVWIDTGSRYENSANNGVAHFLEHINFKGTSKRRREQLEEEVENIGAHLNAYTSREQTVYYAKVFKNDIPRAMEILSDILLNAKLTQDSVEQERGVILREMVEVNKIYEELVLDNLHEIAFPDNGLGLTILGPEKNIQSLNRSDLIDYVQTHYTANRFVIAGAGAVSHEDLVTLSQKYFGSLPTTPKVGSVVTMSKGVFSGAERRIHYNTMKEAHVAYSFEGCSWTSEFALPMMVLQVLLGSWDRGTPTGLNISSRLAMDLASSDAVHSYTTFNSSYKDTGLFGIYFVSDPEKLHSTMEILTRHFSLLHSNLNEDEVERAKNQLKANILVQTDSFSSLCEDIGRQMLTYGRRVSTRDLMVLIDSITLEDVRACGRVFFSDVDHALVAIGPVNENLPSYDWVRERSAVMAGSGC